MYDVTIAGECVVCMDAIAKTVLVPCGHIATCAKCAKKLVKKNLPCPICRRAIRQVHAPGPQGIPLEEGHQTSDGYVIGFYGSQPSAPPMEEDFYENDVA